MGIGDEIMAAGEVAALCVGKPQPYRVAVWDRRVDRQRWCDVWEGDPNIARMGCEHEARYYNHGGARPYIESRGWRRWVWKRYTPKSPILHLTAEERAFGREARDCIVIQPDVKAGASPNKDWGRANWQRLVDLAPDLGWLQVGPPGSIPLSGVRLVHTHTFRQACGVLAGARAAVLQEGGLHHAAAALGIPSVVLFGGFISPQCTGYTTQINLFHTNSEFPLGCGMRDRCNHCVAAMRQFPPERVLKQVEALLQ